MLPAPFLPQGMRKEKEGPEKVHSAFEHESKLFCATWRAAGQTFKAYGFHMWANLPVLYRRFGCLELICQTGVEGMIQKIGRILPHVQLKPTGRYSKETLLGGEEAVTAELIRRRACLRSCSQAVGEELWMEWSHGTYEHLPSKVKANNEGNQWQPRDIMLKVDADIAAGNVMSYDEWCGYWQRWMARAKLTAQVRARKHMEGGKEGWLKRLGEDFGAACKAARQGRGEDDPAKRWAALNQHMASSSRAHRGELHREWRSYYSSFPLDACDDALRVAHKQRMRKSDWRRKKKAEEKERQRAAQQAAKAAQRGAAGARGGRQTRT